MVSLHCHILNEPAGGRRRSRHQAMPDIVASILLLYQHAAKDKALMHNDKPELLIGAHNLIRWSRYHSPTMRKTFKED